MEGSLNLVGKRPLHFLNLIDKFVLNGLRTLNGQNWLVKLSIIGAVIANRMTPLRVDILNEKWATKLLEKYSGSDVSL